MKGRSKRGKPAAKATRNPSAKGPKSRRLSARKAGAAEQGARSSGSGRRRTTAKA